MRGVAAMAENLEDAAWRGSPFTAVHKARALTLMMSDEAQVSTLMLSAYIGSMNTVRSEKLPFLKKARTLLDWGVRAEWHAYRLLTLGGTLDHRQINVLVPWLTRTRFVPGRSVLALTYAREGVALASEAYQNGTALPHELALALVAFVQTLMLWKPKPGSSDFQDAKQYVDQALDLGRAIRAEVDQPQGLRQLVRVLKAVGEFYLAYDLPMARCYLASALLLAESEADTSSQAADIQRLLNDPRLK